MEGVDGECGLMRVSLADRRVNNGDNDIDYATIPSGLHHAIARPPPCPCLPETDCRWHEETCHYCLSRRQFLRGVDRCDSGE